MHGSLGRAPVEFRHVLSCPPFEQGPFRKYLFVTAKIEKILDTESESESLGNAIPKILVRFLKVSDHFLLQFFRDLFQTVGDI